MQYENVAGDVTFWLIPEGEVTCTAETRYGKLVVEKVNDSWCWSIDNNKYPAKYVSRYKAMAAASRLKHFVEAKRRGMTLVKKRRS